MRLTLHSINDILFVVLSRKVHRQQALDLLLVSKNLLKSPYLTKLGVYCAILRMAAEDEPISDSEKVRRLNDQFLSVRIV